MIIRWLFYQKPNTANAAILAPNLLGLENKPSLNTGAKRKDVGSVRVVFVSRIHPIEESGFCA